MTSEGVVSLMAEESVTLHKVEEGCKGVGQDCKRNAFKCQQW